MTEKEFETIRDCAWDKAMEVMDSGFSSGDCCLEYDDYRDASITEVWNDTILDAKEFELSMRTRYRNETEGEEIYAELSEVLDDILL